MWRHVRGIGQPEARLALALALSAVVIMTGCAGSQHPPAPPAPPQGVAAPQAPAQSTGSAPRAATATAPSPATAPAPTAAPAAATAPAPTAAPAAAAAPAPATAPAAATAPAPATAPAAATAPATAPAAATAKAPTPATKPATAAGASPPTAANAPAASAPTSAPAAAVKPAAPTLDLSSLEARLRNTGAIGVMTKLTLKNQVDDLLDQFRAFYQGKLKTTLAQLRQSYDRLVRKVLALLQDADPPLANAIASSREAIWGILADPVKFAAV